MRFESTLIASWSRREWLSVAVITVTAAFLIGSGILLITVGSYTATLEDDLGSSASISYEASYEDARAAADSDEIVFPLVRVAVDGEQPRRVLGIPPDSPDRIESASVEWEPAEVPDPPSEGLYGPVSRPGQRQVGSDQMLVAPHQTESRMFASEWYIGSAEVVTSLGGPRAIVIDTGTITESDQTAGWRLEGVPLIAALPFLLQGVSQIIRTLSLAVVGSGVLVLIIVYNITRMSIRDRRQEIRVARSTGISPFRLFALLEARVAAVTGTGVALGFAVGLISTNAVINAATYAGLPVTIQTVVTWKILWLCLQISGFLFGMGLVAGVLATVPVIRCDPSQVTAREAISDADRSFSYGLSTVLHTTFVGWRALIPTTATLAVFVLIVLLISAIGGAVAPLATTSSGTIVESGSPHPLNSRLSDDYANVLRSQGLSASPEVLYAQTLNGDPYLIRGANFTSFRSVTDARIATGHAPKEYDQAVIGGSLATTLDISVGDTITVGGSVTPGVRRVTVVGMFTGSGITDDQLIVPITTAQELATGTGEVHLIRTDGTTQAFNEVTQTSDTIVVTDLSGSSAAKAGSNYTVSLVIRNLGSARATREIPVQLGSDAQSVDVTLPEGGTERVEVTFNLPGPGTYTVSAAGVTRSVDVYDDQTLVIPAEYPDRAPPDATLIVPAATRSGTTIEDATVTLGDNRAVTTSEGIAAVRVPREAGEYQLTVEKDGYTAATHDLTVEQGVPQRLTGRLTVRPSTGNQLTDPTVEIQLANPWGQLVVRNVSLVTPSTVKERTVEMTGGNITRLTFSASEVGFNQRAPPGSYEFRLVASGTTLATSTYEVTGDERVAATLASEGTYASGTGVGRAIESVFGNVQVLFLIITSLAGLSVVGGTTATFAYAVYTSKRTIGVYRATGARPQQILRLLFADAVRIAIPAALLAFGIAYVVLRVLVWGDILVVFGVRLAVPVSPLVIGATVFGGTLLAVVSAVGAGVVVAYAVPQQLLAEGR